MICRSFSSQLRHHNPEVGGSSPPSATTSSPRRRSPMTRIITVGAAQLGPIQRADSRGAAWSSGCWRCCAQAAEHRLRPRGLPRAGAHDLLPALVDDRPGGDRRLLRARDAVERDGAAVQRGAAARRSASAWAMPRSSGAARAVHRFNTSILVERAGTDRRQVPQDPSARPCRARARARRSSIWRSATSRSAIWAFRCMEDVRRQLRHVHLQRPALARDLSRHGPAERRDGAARLQHAAAQSAGAGPRRHSCDFHNQLSMQAGAYQNGTWVVGVAKAGVEEGCDADRRQRASSRRRARSWRRPPTLGDELVVARCDLDPGQSYKRTTFNFAIHRQPDAVPHDRRAQGRGGSRVIPLPVLTGRGDSLRRARQWVLLGRQVVQVAGGEVARAVGRPQRRLLGPAAVEGVGAAGVEAAALGRVDRARHVALQDDALRAPRRAPAPAPPRAGPRV